MIDFDFNKDCYGCGLCIEACPVNAIQFSENGNGFHVPVVHSEKCIQCGKCDKLCIRLNDSDRINLSNSKVYAFFMKNKKERLHSTSGGAFYALAESVINQGGVVCGCVWDKEMRAEVIAGYTLDDVKRMRGSKYVQSDISCFTEIEEAVKAGKKVLFSGVPCQVAAVQKLYKGYDNLYTVALLCEGTASPKAWNMYKQELESEVNSKMIHAIHRQKGRYGWIAPMAEYRFENGDVKHTLSFTLDEYVHNMIYGYFTRNSCYSCQFKGNNSTADIMIGDFWGLPKKMLMKSRNKGCSVVLVNTDKGFELFSGLEDCHIEETTLECVQRRNPPLLYSAHKNGHRDAVLNEMDTLGFHNTIDKYCNMSTKKVKMQRILHRLGLVAVAKLLLRG